MRNLYTTYLDIVHLFVNYVGFQSWRYIGHTFGTLWGNAGPYGPGAWEDFAGTGRLIDSINWLWVVSSKQMKIQISNSISHWKLWQFTHVCSPNSGDVSIIPIELSFWFCFVWSFAVMFCYMLLCAVIWFKCENYAWLVQTPQARKNIGEMQKMHQVQMLQQVIAIEVVVVHSAVYVGNPRLLGRTDGGCFCWE